MGNRFASEVVKAKRMNNIVARYPVPVRLGAVLVCAVFAVAIARGPVSNGAVIVAVGAACLSVAVLAYRAEIGETEVRIRYAPFFTKRTPIRDVTHVVEERTLVLITPTSKKFWNSGLAILHADQKEMRRTDRLRGGLVKTHGYIPLSPSGKDYVAALEPVRFATARQFDFCDGGPIDTGFRIYVFDLDDGDITARRIPDGFPYGVAG
jgi:hypothetical protein